MPKTTRKQFLPADSTCPNSQTVAASPFHPLLGRPLTLVDTGIPGSEETFLSYTKGLSLAADDLARNVINDYQAFVLRPPSFVFHTPAGIITRGSPAENPLPSSRQSSCTACRPE